MFATVILPDFLAADVPEQKGDKMVIVTIRLVIEQRASV